MSLRRLVQVVTAIVVMVVIVGVIAGIEASWSLSGWAMLSALALGALALHRRNRVVSMSAVALFVLTVSVRMVNAATATGRATMKTLPDGTSSRWLGRMFDEQDISLLGARLLRFMWRLPRDEQRQVVAAMHDTYVEMRRELGMTPSPVLDTLLGRQSSRAFDTILIEPHVDRVGSARAAVIFLHGYAGSFTLECWLVAAAADAIGAVTVCPATDFSGHWASADGERTFAATLRYVRARGIERVYLAGLSNGGIGAGTLAERHASSLRGLILVAGTPSAGGASALTLPTLVVQGERDTMTSAATARAYASRNHATYAGFDGGHFVMMIKRDEVRAAISNWLRQH